GKRLGIGDTEVADTCGKRRRVEGERAEHDIATGAAALHPGARRIRLASLCEVAGGGDAVLPVDLAPAPVQEAPVFATVSRAAAIVDVDDADPALREELRVE